MGKWLVKDNLMVCMMAGRGAEVKYTILKITKFVDNPERKTEMRNEQTVFECGEVNRV